VAKAKLSAKQKAAKAAAAKARRDAKRAAKGAAPNAADAPAAPASTPTVDAKPKKGLQLLSDWNDDRYAFWRDPASRAAMPNGLACPRCGDELMDKSPNQIEPGNPPRADVYCSKDDCSWHGRRLA